MSLTQAIARRRVALGFVTAFATIVLARPTWGTWRVGLAVALVGEALRVWAAGHLEKSREVTRSGPYHWFRHPLYVGSSVLACGVVIAAHSVVIGALAFAYMAVTLSAAIRTEEAFLRQAFGDAYDRYRDAQLEPMRRQFSLSRAVRNREYRAAVGLLAGFGLLALKVVRSL